MYEVKRREREKKKNNKQNRVVFLLREWGFFFRLVKKMYEPGNFLFYSYLFVKAD